MSCKSCLGLSANAGNANSSFNGDMMGINLIDHNYLSHPRFNGPFSRDLLLFVEVGVSQNCVLSHNRTHSPSSFCHVSCIQSWQMLLWWSRQSGMCVYKTPRSSNIWRRVWWQLNSSERGLRAPRQNCKRLTICQRVLWQDRHHEVCTQLMYIDVLWLARRQLMNSWQFCRATLSSLSGLW